MLLDVLHPSGKGHVNVRVIAVAIVLSLIHFLRSRFRCLEPGEGLGG